MKNIIYLVLLNLAFFLNADTLSLNTADTAPYSTEKNNGFYDVLLSEVMQKIDLDLQINHYPSERSILWADEGHDDGEFARIAGLSGTFVNLIEVEEPLVSFYFIAIKKTASTFSPSSWDELKNLRVGYLDGWKIYENNVGDGGKITLSHSIDSLFNMLIEDRLDIILYSKLRAQAYILENNIDGIDIIEDPLSIRTMHLYMHKKHTKIIPQINEELLLLKESGRYDQIFEAYLEE